MDLTDSGNQTWTPGLENLDLTDMDTWTERKTDSDPRTWKFGFKAQTKYGVYTKVRRIYSPKGIVITNLFLSGANSRSACNANTLLTKDRLDPE